MSGPSANPISWPSTVFPLHQPPSCDGPSNSPVSWSNLSPLPCNTTSSIYCNGMVPPSVVWTNAVSPPEPSASKVSPEHRQSTCPYHFSLIEFNSHHRAHHPSVMVPPPISAECSPNASPSMSIRSQTSLEPLAKSEVLSDTYSEDESNSRTDWSPLTPPNGI